jgi:hypothetical protein
MKYYIFQTVEDVEPVIHGSYDSALTRDRAAIGLRQQDPEEENGLFPMNINDEGIPMVYAYSGGFFEPPEEYKNNKFNLNGNLENG